MSNIYILEPPTSGKILLKTTVGDIDVELWSKETPRTCRNFIQLCLEGYYNGLTFHRIAKGFIAQGGDPAGDGTGGESIYGAPFKDEFHQRLRFARRGLLAMANAGKDDNASQFFFTLGATPELQNKHTLFGKITGDTIFNMLKLEEGIIHGETPEFPHRILKTEVLNNPFTDIEPRVVKPVEEKKEKKKRKKGVKDFKLLSFGAEAEEDEVETNRENVKYSGKSKSTHDVLDDPKLSSMSDTIEKKGEESEEEEEEETQEQIDRLEAIKKKLAGKKTLKTINKVPEASTADDGESYEYYLNKDRDDERKKKMDDIKKEIESVKQDYHKNKLRQKEEEEVKEKESKRAKVDIAEYQDEVDKYVEKKKELPAKGQKREDLTMQLLEKFRKKLSNAKEKEEEEEENGGDKEKELVIVDDDNIDENWMSKKLTFKDDNPILAKDANRKDDDWFEIYDPRNPLNKRRRGESDKKSNKKKS